MRLLIILVTVFIATSSFAQQKKFSDSVEAPKYDTTSIDIQSTNSFVFCSKAYKISRICDGQDQSNCCSYSAQIFKGEKSATNGQLGCNNGAGLSWNYFESEEAAKASWIDIPKQHEKQMKFYTKTQFKCFLANQEVNAYRISYESLTGYKRYEILVYGTINGQSVLVSLSSMNKLDSNDDINLAFRQIVRL